LSLGSADRRPVGRGQAGTPARQLLCHELLALEDDDALDEVFQLAHVARPGVYLEALEHVPRQGHERSVVLAAVLLPEVLGEDGDLLGAVAERGDEDIEDVEGGVGGLAEGPPRGGGPWCRRRSPGERTRDPAGRAGAWPGAAGASRRSRRGRWCRRRRARTCRACACGGPWRPPARSRRAR